MTEVPAVMSEIHFDLSKLPAVQSRLRRDPSRLRGKTANAEALKEGDAGEVSRVSACCCCC
jgi:hypothetical protein